MIANRITAFAPIITALAICTAIAGCNKRQPLLDSDVTATAPTTLTSPVSVQSNIERIELSPGGLNGGGTGRGSVIFDLPASPEGQSLSLRSSDPGVSVSPQVIALSGGTSRVDFSFATQPTAADKVVDIIATTASQSKSAKLGVWSPSAPMFFSYASERGDIVGNGGTDRYTPPAFFNAGCDRGTISGSVYRSTGGVFFFVFGAPSGSPLRPGTYENAASSDAANFIRIDGLQRCTRAIGRFTVHDVDFATRAGGKVDRFWVSFEQTCQGGSGTLRGELRLLNPSPTAVGSGTCLGGR